MGVVGKKTQMQRPDIEISIHIEYRVVANLGGILRTELRRSGVEQGCIVGRKITHIHTYLCIQSTEPRTVIIEIVVEREGRQRHRRIARQLIDHVVLEVHPRRSQVALHIYRQHLDISLMLHRQTVCPK